MSFLINIVSCVHILHWLIINYLNINIIYSAHNTAASNEILILLIDCSWIRAQYHFFFFVFFIMSLWQFGKFIQFFFNIILLFWHPRKINLIDTFSLLNPSSISWEITSKHLKSLSLSVSQNAAFTTKKIIVKTLKKNFSQNKQELFFLERVRERELRERQMWRTCVYI